MKNVLLSFFRFPLFIYYFSKSNSEGGRENFGDILNVFIVKNLTSRPILRINPSSFIFRKIIPHYVVIGSILYKTNNRSMVWGTGIMRKDEMVRAKKYFAVRGPRTRMRVLELGYECSETYGDPALLTPMFYSSKAQENKTKYGIVPHYVDYKEAKEYFKSYKDIKVINILDPIKKVIDEINSCKKVLSSSLHGIIISHSYNIPALWLKISNKLSGDDVKFYDYFESVKLINCFSIELKETMNLKQLFDQNEACSLPDQKVIKELQQGLLKSCPFRSKRIAFK